MKVEKIIDKIREGRLRWYGHCRRMKEDDPVKIVFDDDEVEGRRNRGQSKMRWIDAIRRDAREMSIDLDDALDRVSW